MKVGECVRFKNSSEFGRVRDCVILDIFTSEKKPVGSRLFEVYIAGPDKLASLLVPEMALEPIPEKSAREGMDGRK